MPELGGAARLKRFLTAAAVVLASAATGYVGSRIWPLTTYSGPVAHTAAAGNTSSPGPQSREGALPLAPQVSGWVGVTEPSAAHAPVPPPVQEQAHPPVIAATAGAARNAEVESELVGALPHGSVGVSPQSASAGAARAPATAGIEVEHSPTGSPRSPAALSRSPVEQARADGSIEPAATTEPVESKRASAARRPVQRARTRAVRRQSTGQTETGVVEFAPNPSPNQASRDFMARPSSY